MCVSCQPSPDAYVVDNKLYVLAQFDTVVCLKSPPVIERSNRFFCGSFLLLMFSYLSLLYCLAL